jgi:Ca-activated chloride channel family protein
MVSFPNFTAFSCGRWRVLAGMKLILAGFLGLLFLALGQEAIRVDVKLINVGFSVRDARGSFATNLAQDDFEIFEDGVPQKIAFFARSADVRLNLGLLVDLSGSQEHFFKSHHKDLETFLKKTLVTGDRAFLLGFGNHLRVLEDYSSSPQELAEALQDSKKSKQAYPELGPMGEHRILGTAFYDAIYYAILDRLASADRGRRAAIIFSDGEDNSSAHHMLDAIETAQNNNVLLFAVRYTEEKEGHFNARNKYGISVMERLARETGGADYDARAKGLADNFKEIGEQLRSSYELAYHSTNPTPDGTFHKIAIRVKKPGLVARSKTGYYGVITPTTR